MKEIMGVRNMLEDIVTYASVVVGHERSLENLDCVEFVFGRKLCRARSLALENLAGKG